MMKEKKKKEVGIENLRDDVKRSKIMKRFISFNVFMTFENMRLIYKPL